MESCIYVATLGLLSTFYVPNVAEWKWMPSATIPM